METATPSLDMLMGYSYKLYNDYVDLQEAHFARKMQCLVV